MYGAVDLFPVQNNVLYRLKISYEILEPNYLLRFLFLNVAVITNPVDKQV